MLPHPANSSSELEEGELIYCTSSGDKRKRTCAAFVKQESELQRGCIPGSLKGIQWVPMLIADLFQWIR